MGKQGEVVDHQAQEIRRTSDCATGLLNHVSNSLNDVKCDLSGLKIK